MNIQDAVYCIVDIETTGLDPETDRIVEIACVATSTTEVLGMFASLVDGRPCNAVTSAIHGLVDDDLIRAPKWEAAAQSLLRFLARFDGPKCTAILTAHNSAFDQSFVAPGPIEQPWLCTKRLAQQLWPEAPSSSNQALRYWRNLKVDTYGVLPHRALADCLVTAALLRDELERMIAGKGTPIEHYAMTVEELIAFAASPIRLLKWPKGKFYQQPIEAADTSYIEWAIGPRGMTDMDRDLKYTLETELAKRRLSA
jgi:exodeoxyribonuclease X